MTSTKRITTYLTNEDFELFKIALKKYDLKDSGLLREIVHTWLFNNKLNLRKK
jgi:hypothetical protein